jgi:hypothetical protein
MLFPDLFDAKVIHHKGKCSGKPFVLPQARSVDAFIIPLGLKSFS